jgi:leucyl aminopeptidase
MKLLLASAALLLSNVSLAELPAGLKITPKNAAFITEDSSKVVYEGRRSNLSLDNLSSLTEENLYVVSLNTFEDIKSELEDVSKVYLYEEMDFALVEPKQGKLQSLAELIHSKNQACGSLVGIDESSEVLSLAPQSVTPIIDVKSKQSIVEQAIGSVSSQKIKAIISGMESMGTRYHSSKTGKEVPNYLAEKYRNLIPSNRKDVSIELVDVRRSPQKNIVVRIEGSERPEEVVVLGSHIDSIAGRSETATAPGADDDASGTAINMEIFRVLMEKNIKPKRTIEIHGYAAEEVGLVGSMSLASSYKKENVNVVSMVQFDLALYTRSGKLDKMYFVSNGTNKELNKGLVNLVKSYLPAEPVEARLTAGTSDHKSWMSKGYAAAMPTENPRDYNRKIHTKSDRLDTLHENAIKYAELNAKLGVSYVLHYAGN